MAAPAVQFVVDAGNAADAGEVVRALAAVLVEADRRRREVTDHEKAARRGDMPDGANQRESDSLPHPR